MTADEAAAARHQRDLLGQALGRILVASGAVIDQPLSGPELLLAAEDYAVHLESAAT